MKEAQAGLSKVELTGSRLKNIKTDRLSVIDDTYNASPDSMKSAVKVLELSKCQGNKIAILGDMLELGAQSADQHFGVGLFSRGLRIDKIIAIGNDAEHIAKGATGGNAQVAYYSNKEEFFRDMSKYVGDGDIVLVKGSRGMKMEQVVEKLIEF